MATPFFRAHVIISIITLFLSLTAAAQQPVQVIWPLNTDSEAVFSSGIASANFSYGPALRNFTYDSLNGATASGWNGKNLDPKAYFEYTIVPERDATITFNRLKFEVSLSSVNMRTALYYSRDGFSKESLPLGNSVFVGKKSSRDLIVETNITVTYPQTLSIRVYGWSAPNAAVSFFTRDVEFGGVVEEPETDNAVIPGNNETGDEPGGDRSVMSTLTFTTTTTWTCPPGVTSVTAECWGGGGKGGTVTGSGAQVGGGAGGGGYSKKVDIPVVPGTTYTVTVGAGSTDGTIPGGESWFISPATVRAFGGSSVPTGSAGGGAGAPAGTGTAGFIFIGGHGANGSAGSYGGGGGSSAGTGSNGTNTFNSNGGIAPAGGGDGGNGYNGATEGNGSLGITPGGGGGGAKKNNGNGTRTGGNGGSGKVVLTFCATPTAYNVTGGGAYCSGGAGLAIGLSDTDLGIIYQLYLNTTIPIGSAVAGTGNAISFGNQTAAGTYTVIATNTDGMCTNQMNGSAIITINPLPTGTISGTTTVCQNSASPQITFTGSNGTAPYTFTYNINGGGNIISASGNPVIILAPTNVVGAFVYTLVSVQDANGCSATIINQSVTITVTPGTPAQPGPITGPANPCPGLTNQQYSISAVANATTYNWTVPTGWTITSGAGTTSINVTVGAFGQNGNITVTAQNSCGTSTPSTLAVTVQPGTPATPGPISGTITQCPNLPGQVYSIAAVANASSYTWTVPTGWSVTAGAGTTSITVTTGNTGQNGTITVRAVNSCGTSNASNLAVNVGPGAPSSPAAITGTTNVCPNTTNLIYSIAPVANATSYTWALPTGWTIVSGQGSTSVTVTSGSTGQNGNISVTANNGCGNSAASLLAVTVLPGTPSTPGPISGTATQCGNLNGQIYSIAPVANATSYTWTVPTGWSITAGQGTTSITVTTGLPGQNGNITVTATNSCGTSSASILPVTVSPGTPATPGPISGLSDHCFQQTGQIYSINPVTNATVYTWTVPTGWTITAGQGTTSITVTTGTPGQNGNITVTAGNICGTSPARSLAVTVSTVPPQTSPISPAPASVCQGSSVTFSVTAVAGVTYTWAVPADWVITSGQGTNQISVIVGTQAGNITVTPSNNCGSGTPTSHSITVDLLPSSAGPIDGETDFCQGTEHSYSVVAVAGITYNWTVPAGWTITVGQGTNHILAMANGASGQVIVTPQNFCGNGPSSSFDVTVFPLPAAFTGPDGGLCEGGFVQIGGPAVPGNTYSWTSVPAGFTSNLSNPTVNPFETTTYYLTETVTSTGCSNTNDVTITTNEVLRITVDPDSQQICPGAPFTINVTSNVLGTTYYWERDNTTILTGTPDNGTTVPISGTLNSSSPNTLQVTVFTIIGTGIAGSGVECGDKKQAEVTVIDNIRPVITCPIDQVRNTNNNSCNYTVSGTEFDPEVSDNCSFTLTNSFNGNSSLAGAILPVGITNITWSVTDAGLYTESCSFNITIVDNTPPVITCVGNQTVNTNNGCRYLHSGTAWDALATDNCGITFLEYELTGQTEGSGTSLNNVEFNLGVTTVTWTAKDGSNNVQCSYTVTVIDNVPPTITCPGNVAANTSATSCTATLNLAPPTFNDNCSPASLTWSITGATTGASANTGINFIPNGYSFNVGTSTVTYTVTDNAGLTATCSFDVVVTDNIRPTLTCPSTNPFYPNSTNQCYATLSFAATNVLDNCQIQSITYSIGGVPITFPYNFPIGTTSVTVVATDIYGNTSIPCSFNVIVRDTQVPVITCRPSPQTRTANNGSCTYTVIGNEFDPLGFSDNCPGAVITNNYNNNSTLAGASFLIGNTTVIWTVRDAAVPPNSATCQLVITVTDNENPQIINCPTNLTVYTGPGRLTCNQNATWTPPTVNDNCVGTVTLTSNYNPGDLFPVGNTTVTYTATDPSGNSTTCSFVVTVIDNTKPTFTAPANTTIYVSASCTYNASVGVTGDVTNEFDNCTPSGLEAVPSDVTVPGACPGTFVITRTWLLTDIHGNTETKVQTITVDDNIAPTLVAPPEITVQCHQGTLPAVTGQPTVSDNCGNPVTVTYLDNTTPGTCPQSSNITRTWTAADCRGNTTVRTQIIHVRDNTDPVITNVVNHNVNCPDDIPEINTADITATDNCGTVTITFDHEVAQFPPDVPGYCPRHITRYYRVEDQCGNFVFAQQEIVIASVCDCSNCNDETETYTVDLLGQPNGTIVIEDVRRLGLCCHAEEPNDCISFNVRIDPGSVGVQITVNGATPGPHEWKVDCEDVEINNGIICLPGGAFYLFTFCKPGQNPNDYTFTALADIVVAGEFNSRVSCNTQVQVTTNVTNIVWNSISPGAPGQYNSYLSCTNCPNPIFTPGPGAPPVIKYQICGDVANSPCTTTLGFGCDTITMYVHEPIQVTFNVDPGQFCLEAIPQIIASVTPEGTTYILEWFAGSDTTVAPLWTGNGFTPPGPGPYTLKVTDTEVGVPCSIYLYPFIVAPDDDPPVITVPAPITLECNNPSNPQTIQDWLAQATATDEHPITNFSNNYNGVTESCNAVTTVTWTATDDCNNTATASSTITIRDTQVPTWLTTPGSLNQTLECSNAAGLLAAQNMNPVATDQCDATPTITKTSGAFVPGLCPQAGTYTNTWIATDDCNNISIAFTQVITITDNTAPVWTTTPGSLNASFDCSDVTGIAAAQALVPVATDNCDTSLTLVENSGPFVPNPACANAGTYTNTFTVSDDCGNTSGVFTQVITITDNNLPVITLEAQNMIVECDGTGNIPELNNWLNNHGGATATDACGGILAWSYGTPVFQDLCGQTGVYTVVFTVTDNCNNTATTTATFTIRDTQAPVLTCPPNVIAQVDLTNCVATGVNLGTPTAIEACSNVTYTNNAPAAFPPGVTVVTWTGTDECGNSSTCTQTVTVQDLLPPSVVCPPDPAPVNAAAGQCSAYVTVPSPNVTDPCPYTLTNNSPYQTSPTNASGTYPVGTTVVTWTITGISGISATCVQNVTVLDNQAPSITCPPNVLVTAPAPACTLQVITIQPPVLNDNCNPLGLILTWEKTGATTGTGTGDVNGTIFNVGITTVTYTVTDPAGLTATCSFTVTVNDQVPPTVINCPADITVNTDPGECFATVIIPPLDVDDPCDELVTIVNDFNGTDNASGQYPVGTTTVTWTITDRSGNVTYCIHDVTVNDNVTPSLTCPPDAIDLITNGGCTLIPATIQDPLYSDNCMIGLSLTWQMFGATTGTSPATGINLVNGQTFNVGRTRVLYTLTDASGNFDTCSFYVWIKNLNAPQFHADCPVSPVNAVAGVNCNAFVTVPGPAITNPCNELYTVTNTSPYKTSDSDASGTYPVGTTTFTWTITDASGNVTTCDQSVVVTDQTAPSLTCPPDAIDMITNGGCTLVPATIQDPVYSDNCPVGLVLTWQMFGATTGVSPNTGINLVNGQTFNVGRTRVLYTLTDASGNFDTCSFYVWVKNLNAPQFQADCPVSPVNAVAGANCNAFVNVPGPAITNPCNELYTVTNTSPYKTSDIDASGTYPVGTTTFTWTITDASGNVTTCTQSVIVTDNIIPSLTCPPDAIDEITNGGCTLIPATIQDPVYSDNCLVGLTLTWQMFGATTGTSPATGINLVSGQTFNVGRTRVLYTLTDASGNFDTCSFYVWIKNLDAPQFHADCPVSPVNAVAGVNCNAFVTVPGPAITNPCNELYTVTNTSPYKTSDSDASGTYPVGTTTFTWTITDASGNVTTCDQSVIVTDQTAPSLTCPPDAIDMITNGGCTLVPATIQDPVYSDNCPVGLTLTWQMFGATTGVSPNTGINLVNGQTFNVGRTRVLYTLTDASGNFDTCSFYVWVKNLNAPQFHVDCPLPASVTANANADCEAYVNVPAPVITNPCNELYTVDNTSPYKTTNANASGTYPRGTTDFEWIVTDASGNVTRCPFSVTVIDVTPPTLICPPDAVDEITNGGCDLVPGTIQNPATTDNCDEGDPTNTLTLTWEMFGATTGISAQTGYNLVNGETFKIGITRVLYTLTDASGNFDTCSFYVWIKNLGEPQFDVVCPANVTVSSNPNSCNAFVTIPQPTIINPCDEAYKITNDSPYGVPGDGLYPVGTTTITWDIIDASGTHIYCTQIITVVDDVDPLLTCPPSQVVDADYELPYATGIVLGTPAYSDNCGILSLTWVHSATTPGSSPLTGINIDNTSTFNVGVTTITYTATDIHGNVTTCDFTITVLSEPVIECPADISTTTDPGVCSATLDPGGPTKISGVEPITWTYTIRDQGNFIIGSGNCTTATISTCIGMFEFPVGTNTITWTATNVSGTTECVQTIIVVDDEPPTYTPFTPFERCVNSIITAKYDGAPEPNADIIPIDPAHGNPRRPDWYFVASGSTELDIPGLTDNCCATNEINIAWTIVFDPITGYPPISGTGQPSLSTPIYLWGTYTNVNVTHTITYIISDCNGNTSNPIIRNLLITPRPNIIKQY